VAERENILLRHFRVAEPHTQSARALRNDPSNFYQPLLTSPTTIPRSLRFPSVILAAVVVWMFGLTPSASAAVKLSNLESPSFGGVRVDANLHKAQPFRTTASGPFEITTVTLRMTQGSAAAGGFSVAIYSGASAPSQLVTNGRLAGESESHGCGQLHLHRLRSDA